MPASRGATQHAGARSSPARRLPVLREVAAASRSKPVTLRRAAMLALALAPACAGASRPVLMPRGNPTPTANASHQAIARSQSPPGDGHESGGATSTYPHQAVVARFQSTGGYHYQITLTYDPTPTYGATGPQASCEESAPPGTANHELRLQIKSLEAHHSVALPNLEIHVSAPRTVALSQISTLWADPGGCLVGTGTSRRKLAPHASVTIRGSLSRLPVALAPGSGRVFLSEWGVAMTKPDGAPELDENGYRLYADEVVTMRVP
jgi:hypothetical protein